jgi:hypothetical protein
VLPTEPPRTGIFNALRIVIDPDVGFEMQCFLLLTCSAVVSGKGRERALC